MRTQSGWEMICVCWDVRVKAPESKDKESVYPLIFLLPNHSYHIFCCPIKMNSYLLTEWSSGR